MAITISTCQTSRALRLFEKIPEKIQRTEACFVPPFPGSVTKIIRPGGLFSKHGTVFPLVAFQDGMPVGRIAAVVNNTHNQFYADQTGFFGFFDSIDDVDVATALVESAAAILKQHGLKSMRGPFNPSINDDFGVLIEGFNHIPFVMMPHNPPYYAALLEATGFQRVRDFYTYQVDASNELPEKVRRVVERVRSSSGVTLRQIDMKKLDEELKIIQELYNLTLDRNWGFVPVSYEDIQNAAEELRAIVDPNLIFFAEKNGQPIGYSLMIPNINEFLHRTKKSTRIGRIVRFVWALKTSRPQEIRLAALGMHPEHRQNGIPALFYYETLMRSRGRYRSGEMGWIEESNKEVIRAIELMGGKHSKTYRVFEMPIGHETSSHR